MSAQTKKEPNTWPVRLGEGDRKLTLFEWVSGKGKATIYVSVPTEKLPCGTRTRSLRHGDREVALKWAEEVLKSGVELDTLEIPKPVKEEAKANGTKPKAKRSPKGKAESKKSTKKARR